MNSPYDPPTSEIESFDTPPAELSWVRYTRWILSFCGALYVLMGVFSPLILKLVSAMDKQGEPMPTGILVGLGLFLVVICGGFGVLNLVAAWGLGQRRKWAWVLAVVVGGIYAPSACLPFGALILYGMLNERVRKVYLG